MPLAPIFTQAVTAPLWEQISPSNQLQTIDTGRLPQMMHPARQVTQVPLESGL